LKSATATVFDEIFKSNRSVVFIKQCGENRKTDRCFSKTPWSNVNLPEYSQQSNNQNGSNLKIIMVISPSTLAWNNNFVKFYYNNNQLL